VEEVEDTNVVNTKSVFAKAEGRGQHKKLQYTDYASKWWTKS
jgi:hypothetical protein